MLRPPSPAALACALLLGACGGGSAKKPGLIGADCSVGRDSACASSRCLALDSSTAYCTQSCQAAADCPAGYLCASAPTGGAGCPHPGAGGDLGGGLRPPPRPQGGRPPAPRHPPGSPSPPRAGPADPPGRGG